MITIANSFVKTTSVVIIIFISFFSCGRDVKTSSRIENLSVNTDPYDPREFLSLDQILERNPKSVDELLTMLPQVHKVNFVLVKKSRSRHLATEQYPRIILFGDSIYQGQTMYIGISGNPEDPNYQVVEFITFNQEANEFEFKFIDFARPETPVKNPSLCKTCHTNALRPIWDVYPSWPGAYGEGDAYSQQELDAVAKIITTSKEKNSGRYRFLDIKNHSIVYSPRKASPAFDLFNRNDNQARKYYVSNKLKPVIKSKSDRKQLFAALAICSNFPEAFTKQPRDNKRFSFFDEQMMKEAERLTEDQYGVLKYLKFKSTKAMRNLRYLYDGKDFEHMRWIGSGFLTPHIFDVTYVRVSSLIEQLELDLKLRDETSCHLSAFDVDNSNYCRCLESLE